MEPIYDLSFGTLTANIPPFHVDFLFGFYVRIVVVFLFRCCSTMNCLAFELYVRVEYKNIFSVLWRIVMQMYLF